MTDRMEAKLSELERIKKNFWTIADTHLKQGDDRWMNLYIDLLGSFEEVIDLLNKRIERRDEVLSHVLDRLGDRK